MLKASAPAEKDEKNAELALPDGVEDAHEQDEKMELVLQAVSTVLISLFALRLLPCSICACLFRCTADKGWTSGGPGLLV